MSHSPDGMMHAPTVTITLHPDGAIGLSCSQQMSSSQVKGILFRAFESVVAGEVRASIEHEAETSRIIVPQIGIS